MREIAKVRKRILHPPEASSSQRWSWLAGVCAARAPVGQQLEEKHPFGSRERCEIWQLLPLPPLDTRRVRAPTVSSGYGLGSRKSTVIAIRLAGQEPGQQWPAIPVSSLSRRVWRRTLPPVGPNKAAIKFSQSNKRSQAAVVEVHRSDAATHTVGGGASPILGKSSDGVRYCITRRHCFVNVTSSVFDLISRCSGQCENPYQVHDPAPCSLWLW